jgi:hypothetical protein
VSGEHSPDDPGGPRWRGNAKVRFLGAVDHRKRAVRVPGMWSGRQPVFPLSNLGDPDANSKLVRRDE